MSADKVELQDVVSSGKAGSHQTAKRIRTKYSNNNIDSKSEVQLGVTQAAEEISYYPER